MVQCQAETNNHPDDNPNQNRQPVVRRFINSAVYVETPIQQVKQDPAFCQEPIKFFKVKRCVCSTDKENCPCHPDSDNGKTTSRSSASARTTSSETTIHFRPTKAKTDLRLSLTSVASAAKQSADDQERERVFKEWLAKKQKEKLKQQRREERLRQLQEEERERQIERERENFRVWLRNKKKQEEKLKREKLKQEEEERAKEEMKAHKELEKEINFQYWLKRKEKQYLEKKLHEKIKILELAEERQRRLEESAKAYDDWLKNSKNKPKPIPLNQGLESLRSSVSVTYVNPTPWVNPVDEEKIKPASQ